MTTEIFKANNYDTITKEEYGINETLLDSNVFNLYHKKGSSKNLVAMFQTAIPDFEQKYKIKEENEIYIQYNLCSEKKERLFTYFGKDLIEEKLTKKNEYFRGVLEQIETIENLISPVFKELGIDYELHLTGGALRDHILNKSHEVKDLDILIEFADNLCIENMQGNNILERIAEQKTQLEKFFLEKKDIIKKYGLQIHYGQTREKILHEIVFQLVNKIENTEVKNFLLWDEKKEGNQSVANPQQPVSSFNSATQLTPDDSIIYDGLFSVIKISGEKFKYPIDLLLNSNRHTYLSHFDFNICKCLYTIKKLDTNKEIDRLYLYQGFVEDVIEKKLSLNTSVFYDQKQVDRCLQDHYIRLKKKYPDYLMNILQSSIKDELMQYIEKAYTYYLMEYKLAPKGNVEKIKTKKI